MCVLPFPKYKEKMDVTVATRNTIASAARKILMIKQTPYFIIHIL
jgi:hypothetical protein